MPVKNDDAPAFLIKIDGTRLAKEKEVDVKEITIEENMDKPSFFSIIVSDSEGAWADSKEINIGSLVSISLGFTDDVHEIIKGEITSLSSRFVENGGKLYVLSGFNKLHRMLRGRKVVSYANKTPSDIVSDIISNAGMSGNVDSFGTSSPFFLQNYKSDYDQMMEIAGSNNCKVYMDGDKVCCKEINTSGNEEFVFEWNKTLIDFNVEMDTSQIVTGVEVRGWDQKNLEAIVGKKEFGGIQSKVGGSKTGGKFVSDSFGDYINIVFDNEVADKSAAEKLALNILTDNSFNFINGKAKARGNPKVKIGTIAGVKGVGNRFSGKYFVKGTRHLFSTKTGYLTYLQLTRNAAN